MPKIKVALVTLGSLKYPVNLDVLTTHKSAILAIARGSSVAHLPDARGPQWSYPDTQLQQLISHDATFDFTFAVINAPLEDNYYLRRLSQRVAVLSLFEMAEILHFSNFSLENFILRNLYELTVLQAANGGLIPDDARSWAHDDIRGCLFDMNANKADIRFSLHKPILCPSCTARIMTKQLDQNFLEDLKRELLLLRKPLYFRVSDAVKAHPIVALVITAFFGIFLNLIASVLFELLHSRLG